MNINPEFQSPERANVEDVMAEGMDFLFIKFILPENEKLDQNDLETGALIGIALEDIASQAEAYYKMYEDKENDISRN